MLNHNVSYKYNTYVCCFVISQFQNDNFNEIFLHNLGWKSLPKIITGNIGIKNVNSLNIAFINVLEFFQGYFSMKWKIEKKKRISRELCETVSLNRKINLTYEMVSIAKNILTMLFLLNKFSFCEENVDGSKTEISNIPFYIIFTSFQSISKCIEKKKKKIHRNKFL